MTCAPFWAASDILRAARFIFSVLLLPKIKYHTYNILSLQLENFNSDQSPVKSNNFSIILVGPGQQNHLESFLTKIYLRIILLKQNLKTLLFKNLSYDWKKNFIQWIPIKSRNRKTILGNHICLWCTLNSVQFLKFISTIWVWQSSFYSTVLRFIL